MPEIGHSVWPFWVEVLNPELKQGLRAKHLGLFPGQIGQQVRQDLEAE